MDLAIKEIKTEIWTLSPRFACAYCLILHDRTVKTPGPELMVDYFQYNIQLLLIKAVCESGERICRDVSCATLAGRISLQIFFGISHHYDQFDP